VLGRDAAGREALVRDRKGNAAAAWTLAGAGTAIVLFAVLLSRQPSPAPPSPAAIVIAWLLVGGMAGTLLFFAALLAFGRVSIVARDGIVESRLDFLGRAFVRSLAVDWLHVERDRASDHPQRYDLVAIGEGRRLPLESSRYGTESLVGVARWLAGRLGVPLDIDEGFPAATRRHSPAPGLDQIRAARARGKDTPR
jgi:hypothetical protein